MGKLQTHPGIKNTIMKLISDVWDPEEHKIAQSEDKKLLHKAATSQCLLGHKALEKGYIMVTWKEVQEIWSKHSNGALKHGLEN